MTTNITDEAKDAFQALVSGEYDSFAIFSCFYDGEPTSVIVNVTRDGDEFCIDPLFVHLTESMQLKLTNHAGLAPGEAYGQLEINYEVQDGEGVAR
jgi:hypothetical protein